MKRTATTVALLAGFGGGCVSPGGQTSGVPQSQQPIQAVQPAAFGAVSKGKQVMGYQGPNGEPILAAAATGRGAMPDGGIQQVMFRKVGTPTAGECASCAVVPGTSGSHAWGHGGNQGPPPNPGLPGILPVPGQGAPGAVAAYGAIVPGMGGMGGPMTGAPANGRASIKFTGPAGMNVTWQTPGGGFNPEASGLTAPTEYNFLQGQVYRLRLTSILPNHPGRSFYPTLEVASANPKTLTFLAHSCVPITFTNDDFDHAVAGNLVVKVVYLPDRDNQDFLTIAGAEEVNSTRLEPGLDPVAEAQRKGSILAIIRLGNIDLENKSSPGMAAPPPGGFMPPGGPMMMPRMVGPDGGMDVLPPGSSSVGGPMSPVAPPRPGLTPPPSPSAPLSPLAPGPLPPAVGNNGRPQSLPPGR
jgi:hypothetical protein